MRMHRKSRLEERMASCADIVTVADLTDKNMKRAASTPEYLPFADIFGNGNPVELEIGCGKGRFICEKAKANPGINFVAVEKISNVLIEALERAKSENIKNLYFLNCAAEVLEKYLPQNSVETLYLNFSNPLPKEGYKKQRLTHPRFLEIYKSFMISGGKIIQKTDDKDFFGFSLDGYRAAGFRVLSICENYAALESGDVETEHEKKFRQMGKPVFRAVTEVI